tara:strand:+ start:172 stop:483 length:312 start_codon:yes stop_codon:yes gene_type:complete
MNLAQIKSKELMPGCHGKMVHGHQITWAFWNIEEGATVPKHNHHHEQIMHVVDGKFEFTLDGETKLYTVGDVIHIPPNVPHSGKAITICKLMDVFSPVREEYK